jgi:hypothetical protein
LLAELEKVDPHATSKAARIAAKLVDTAVAGDLAAIGVIARLLGPIGKDQPTDDSAADDAAITARFAEDTRQQAQE